jgi:long-chain acyl-CoA synthetase
MYGDSLRDNIIGIVVIDPAKLTKYAQENGKGTDDATLKTLLDDNVKNLVLADIQRLAKENQFSSLEKPKDLYITLDPFTVENDLLTPTMKLKRNIAKTTFQAQIDECYARIAATKK